MSDKEFYDLCYDAWREGRNPDMVNRDTYETMKYYDIELSWRDCYPNRGRPQEQEPDPRDFEEDTREREDFNESPVF